MGFRMERKGTKVKVTDGTEVTEMELPQNRMALSILGVNPGIDGGRFAGDGWVYIGDKRIKKWFISFKRIRLWEPKLDNLLKLEKSYWRAYSRLVKFWEKEYNPVFQSVVDVGSAHAKPTHKYKRYENKTWWFYTAHLYGEDSHSIGFDWVEPPKDPIHPEIGQKYYMMSRQHDTICGHSYMFATVLERAITKYLDKNVELKESRMIDLVLNNRRYLYVCVQDRNHLHYQKISWPKDDCRTLTLL